MAGAVRRGRGLADHDPYLFWADASHYAAVLDDGGWLRMACELSGERQREALVRALDQELAGLRLAPHYRLALQRPGCRHFCVDVPKNDVAALASRVWRLKLGFIGNSRQRAEVAAGPVDTQALNVAALKPAAVRRLRAAVAAGGRGAVRGLGFLAAGQIPPVPRPSKDDPDGSGPLVAVIDFGCAFAHPSFLRSADRTRVVHLWDQGRAAADGLQDENQGCWPWTPQADFGYGREASGQQLDRLMGTMRSALLRAAGGQPPAARFEEACYVAAALPELLEPWSHGSAVLGAMAGWPHPWVDPSGKPDAAGAADIVFVQLPQAAIEDLSGGWVAPYLLDAVEYVIAKAGQRPVVINISIGAHAGPHDGGSLIEQALERAAARPGVSIVLAAGNAADKLGHAQATLPAGARAELRWALPDQDPTQSFLEFWYPQVAEVAAPLAFDIHHPRHPAARLSQSASTLADAQGRPYAGFVHLPKSRGGRRSGTALLAMAPTRTTAAQAAAGMGDAPDGSWSITVHNVSSRTLELHAWVERDEPGAATNSTRPDAVLVAPPGSAFRVCETSTLTGQAGGQATWVVGGYDIGRPAQPPGTPRWNEDSGRGPSRAGGRAECDALGPADLWIDGLARGLPVLSSRSPEPGTVQPDVDDLGNAGLHGTSLAAPWVARQLFNLVAADPTLDSKTKLLGRLRRATPQVDPVIDWLCL